ncbi:hypothetical protein [Legionella clemsonensis]|uniref:Substrate of the Dot/Icm secretion system n=1 Tax=Legionella clemsonensis TaxID=1867846 RepID=A0A222P0V7_9GAMM|nr:hypothetical protein [Legionella clemsonensis]ASQ45425.1 hypothetical protein clem_04335 [Legionella clemsonensis]
MGYKLPGYRYLHNNTNILHDTFNKLINRYIPPTYEQVRQKVSSFPEKYNEKVNKKSGLLVNTTRGLRLDQSACISLLLPKLPEEGSVQEINQAHNILLGAVIYRFLRIKKSYKPKYYSYFGYSPKDSCTYQILEEDFEFDKQQLDAETIATCCEAYLAYLEQEVVTTIGKKQKVGDQFPYIKEDVDFYKNLKAIIRDARAIAQPITAQLKIISFVQSVAVSFRTMDNNALEVLPKLSSVVSNKLKKSPAQELTSEDVAELLDTIHPAVNEAAKETLKLVLPDMVTSKGVFTKVIISNSSPIRTEDKYLSFQDYVQEALIMNSQYALLGAYILALSRSEADKPELKDALNHAIAAQGVNQLDEKTKKWGLVAFHNYVTIPGIPAINYKCWHADTGYEHMDKELQQQLNKLSRLKEKEEEVFSFF